MAIALDAVIDDWGICWLVFLNSYWLNALLPMIANTCLWSHQSVPDIIELYFIEVFSSWHAMTVLSNISKRNKIRWHKWSLLKGTENFCHLCSLKSLQNIFLSNLQDSFGANIIRPYNRRNQSLETLSDLPESL